MTDGVWNNGFDEGEFWEPDSYFDEDTLYEAMNGAYVFLMSPRWIALKRLGFPPKIQVSIIDTMIKYFVDLEEYEKCAKLLEVQDKIKLRYLIGVLDNPKTAHSASGSDSSRMTDDI